MNIDVSVGLTSSNLKTINHLSPVTSKLLSIRNTVHVDPAKRYQSALEMRRALDQLSYSGYWSTDVCGKFKTRIYAIGDYWMMIKK